MRKEFKMTKEELTEVLDASKPVRYMVFGGRGPMNPQEKANIVWHGLGKKYGFKPMTVKPVSGKSQEYFTAEVVKEEQCDEVK